MLLFFLIVGLVFLISGGVGLFHVNANQVTHSDLWFYGNIIFGVFAAVGLLIIIFLAIFNKEFD
jgi:hypothetical protein